MKLLKELNEQTQLDEGFMGYTVVASDTAADLYFGNVLDAVVPILRKGLKDKGNKYNTSGLENVAMILLEKFKKDIGNNSKLEALAREVGKKLLDEAVMIEDEDTTSPNYAYDKKARKAMVARYKKWGNELLKVTAS